MKNKKAPAEWPKGNLKCDWNMMILSHEDFIKEMDKRKKYIYIFMSAFFISLIFACLILWILEGTFGLIMSLSLLPIFSLLGIFIFFIFRYSINYAKNPNNRKEVKVGWSNVNRDFAILSVKKYVDTHFTNYRFEYNKKIRRFGWKYPEEQYYLENGIIIKSEYGIINKHPAGWLAIDYYPKDWEKALDIQLDMDRYLYRTKIVKIR